MKQRKCAQQLSHEDIAGVQSSKLVSYGYKKSVEPLLSVPPSEALANAHNR